MEKEVIVWSDSQRVALIRSMAEQTVFTDSDRESLLQSLYRQFLSVECFCIYTLHTYASVCVFVCTVSSSVLIYMLRSSVLLCLAAQAPIAFFPRLSPACTLPLSSNPRPAALCKGK